MCDASGDSWIKHIQYGTSKLLQLRGPSALFSDSFRSFFFSVRVYEICRALIFNEETFLDEPGWKALTHQIWENAQSGWHPKEDLLGLMVSCISLNMRYVSAFLRHIPYTDTLIVSRLSMINPRNRRLRNFATWQMRAFKSKHHSIVGHPHQFPGQFRLVKSIKCLLVLLIPF